MTTGSMPAWRRMAAVTAIVSLLTAGLSAPGSAAAAGRKAKPSLTLSSIPGPVAGGWRLNGDAVIASPALSLTDVATTYEAGSAFWPDPVSSAGIHAKFDTYIGSGTGGDGLTLTLADASLTKPTALGVTGGGLGYSGIAGVAVALDTYHNSVNPSGNFVGLATGGVYDKLVWAATNTSVPALRDVTHRVEVTTTTNHVTVALDGATVLDAAVPLPPSVLVGFTAGDGTTTDIHSVSNVAITIGNAPPPPDDSATYLGGNARTNYFPAETALKPANIASLAPKWVAQGGVGSSTQPIPANGLIYWGDWTGHEHATKANGTDQWSTPIGSVTDAACSPATVGVASTATVASVGGRSIVYVGGGDGNSYALDALTGAVIWKTSLGALPDHFIWDSPAVFDGSVYIGVASLCDNPLVQGQLFRLDASTGAVQAVLDLAPSNCTGAGIIGSPTVDKADGSLYLATGNGGGCAGTLGEALVKVRASDLSVVSSWIVPAARAPGDSDFVATPTLFTASINGVAQRLVGAANKNGTFYAFRRWHVASGPVWQTAIANGGDDPEGGDGSIVPAAFDGVALYIGGGSETVNGQACHGSVQALNPATGAVLWSACVSGPVLAAPSVVPGVVFVGSGATFYAFATSNGAQLYSYTNPSLQVFYGAATPSSGVVYVPNMTGDLLAFAP